MFFGIRTDRTLCLGGVAGSEPIFPLHEWCRPPLFANVTEITAVAPWHLAIQAIYVHNVWVPEPFYLNLHSANTVDRYSGGIWFLLETDSGGIEPIRATLGLI